MREPGFYWVKTGKYRSWEIAEYNDANLWYFTGNEYGFDGDEFEIDERQIVKEQQCKDAGINLDGAKLLVFKDHAEYEKFLKEHEKHFVKLTD